nr:MAG TPA: hypothetical protein [Bacteriophage sp.]
MPFFFMRVWSYIPTSLWASWYHSLISCISI